MTKQPMLPVVILAGGLATRLRPITTHFPKALISINDEPFISHQLNLLKSQHITDVVLCVGYLGEMIREYVGDGSAWGLRVQYSFDGDTLLGTGGSLKKALPLIQSDTFFVMYGDSYLPCHFKSVQDYFLTTRKISLMTVFHNEGLWDHSNVIFKDRNIVNYDKVTRTPDMHYIDYGLGILHKKVFDLIPDNTIFDLAELYQLLLKRNELAGFEVTERFYEIGSHSGIEECAKFFNEQVVAQKSS